MKSSRNIFGLALAGVIFILIGCSSQTTDDKVSTDQEVPVHPVEIMEVTKGILTNETRLSGNVLAGEHMPVIPMLAGEVTAVHVENGDKVERGDILIEIQAEDIELSIAQARAGLEAAEANLKSTLAMQEQGIKQAEFQLEQAKNVHDMLVNAEDTVELELDEDLSEELRKLVELLIESNLPTENDIKQAKNAVKQAELAVKQAKSTDQIDAVKASVKQAEIAVQMAEQQLKHAVVRAPISGQVSGFRTIVGSLVSPQAPLLQIVQMDAPIVQVNVNESLLPSMEKDQEVTIRITSYNELYKGKISYISLLPGEQSRSYPVEIEIINADDKWRVGMHAEVILGSAIGNEQVLVPVSAVHREEDRLSVYVTTDGIKVDKREITIFDETHEWYAIGSGVEEGEFLVTRGNHQLYDGAYITVRNDLGIQFKSNQDEMNGESDESTSEK
ncbi:efflux RND transporter periplasmic adaptor subunit [Evansella sp. AB-rgal1]|uniref:efflux RND transporter periplasmic adaptor subunit n=1 Tax=Evansella sp. AB-rgal1 TaxID=3242696 RepID=UPI00359DC6CC